MVFLFKQIYKPNSVCVSRIKFEKNTLIIYLRLLLPANFSCLPSNIVRAHSIVSIHDIAPHRVYLISLQHNLYLLSVALFLTFRWMAVNHYDCTMVFGLSSICKTNSDKAIYLITKVQLIVNNSYQI